MKQFQQNGFWLKPHRSQIEPKTFTLQEVKDVAFKIGFRPDMIEKYFHWRNSIGWLDGAHRAIISLESDMMRCKNDNYVWLESKDKTPVWREL